jgi:SAM-dependent methyltransferase
MKENFRPVAHNAPDTFLHTLKFYGRLLLDFQALTIYKHLKPQLSSLKGKVLDVGCGNSPFKFLLNSEKTQYLGIDIANADSFDYKNPDITVFDGENIPFVDSSFENIISTEVIEHIDNPEKIISEMHRVLIKGGKCIITLPWSARIHFSPHDFCRYTPYKLSLLFREFESIEILNRGTDINSTVSKMIVIFLGNLISWDFDLISVYLIPVKIAVLLFFIPIISFAVIFSHISLLFNLGSENDPLGYTIILKK